MIPTRKQPAKIFLITYKYDVDAEVINNIILHTNDKKVRGNKYRMHM